MSLLFSDDDIQDSAACSSTIILPGSPPLDLVRLPTICAIGNN